MRAARSKLFAALAIALGMLMLAATPASAAVVCVPVPANGVSGILTIDDDEFPFPNPGSEPPCESDLSGLHFKFEENLTPPPDWFWWVKGTIKLVFELPEGSGNWWQADITFDPDNLPNGGGLTWDNAGPPPEWIVDGLLTPGVIVYALDEDCDKDNPVCELLMQLEIDDTVSRHYGSVPPVPGSTTHIEAATDPNGIRPFTIGSSCDVTIQAFLDGVFVGLVMNIAW